MECHEILYPRTKRLLSNEMQIISLSETSLVGELINSSERRLS